MFWSVRYRCVCVFWVSILVLGQNIKGVCVCVWGGGVLGQHIKDVCSGQYMKDVCSGQYIKDVCSVGTRGMCVLVGT